MSKKGNKSKKRNSKKGLTAYQKLIRNNSCRSRSSSYYNDDFGCAYIWSDGRYVPVPAGFIGH